MTAAATAGAPRDILVGAPAFLRAEDADLPQSPQFVALRERAHELVRRTGQLRLGGASPEEIDAAERATVAAEDAALTQLLADRAVHIEAQRRTVAEERERSVINGPMDAAVARVVRVLDDSGPLSGVEIEALRLPGLSHNVVRPVLREAAARGLVVRRQVGRRVFWSTSTTAAEVAGRAGRDNLRRDVSSQIG